MTLPGFSAGYSLYRASGHYRSAEGSPFDGSQISQWAVPAYYPKSESMGKCQARLEGCLQAYGICVAGALLFPPAIAACNVAQLTCTGIALAPGTDCCPKVCELDPFNQPGGGCCDYDEHCVDIEDPNSRHGCCPAGQNVCGGKCCRPGEKCCGGSCCPSAAECCGDECGCSEGRVCQNGTCVYPPFGPYTPVDPGVTQIPKPESGCPPGWKECRNFCCAPDMKCCGYGCDAACVN
jgi:hypothetical protein